MSDRGRGGGGSPGEPDGAAGNSRAGDAGGPRDVADALDPTGEAEPTASDGSGGATPGTGAAAADADGGPPGPDAGLDDVVRRPAAAVGTVAAALALAAAVPRWTGEPATVPGLGAVGSPAGALLAGLAVAGFLVARHGDVDRAYAAALAGAGGAGVVLLALYEVVAPATGGGSAPDVGAGLALGAGAGILCVGFAVAHARRTTASQLLEMARRTAVGLGLVLGTFLTAVLVIVPLSVLEFGPVAGLVVEMLVIDAAILAVGLGFLVGTGRGLDYVDLRVPGVRDLAYVGLGIVVLLGALVGISQAMQLLELPSAQNAVVEPAMEGNHEYLLVLIPMSFLLVGPAEELLYRNVVQKYLYGAFSRPGAVVVASGVFAAAHLSSYANQNPVATLVSLLVVFVLSMVLGGIYERTDNLLVPAFVHGTYNATLFAILYLFLEYGDPEQLVAAPPRAGELVAALG